MTIVTTKKTIPWRLNGISQGCTGAMALHAAHARGINRGQPRMPRAMGTGISWGAWFYLGFDTQQAAEILEKLGFYLGFYTLATKTVSV